MVLTTLHGRRIHVTHDIKVSFWTNSDMEKDVEKRAGGENWTM